MSGPEQRLFVYGTLAPGRENAHVLSGLRGDWEAARMRGRLFPVGTEPIPDYPVIVSDESADWIEGQLLSSPDLPSFWPELDRFETSAYRRELVSVHRRPGPGQKAGIVQAFTYTFNGALSHD